MTYACFSLDVTDGIGTLTLNRPDAYNSMTPDFWAEFPHAIQALSDGGKVRAVIIASTGKHFCAGMDLAVFTDPSGSAEKREVGRQRANLRSFAMRMQDAFTALETGPHAGADCHSRRVYRRGG